MWLELKNIWNQQLIKLTSFENSTLILSTLIFDNEVLLTNCPSKISNLLLSLINYFVSRWLLWWFQCFSMNIFRKRWWFQENGLLYISKFLGNPHLTLVPSLKVFFWHRWCYIKAWKILHSKKSTKMSLSN